MPRLRFPWPVIFVAVALVACGGADSKRTTTPHGHGEGDPPSMDIRKAALPYKLLRARGGAEIDEETFFAEVGAADAVCIGESHRNPHHHWVQLMVVERLVKQAGGSVELALGMEMFQTPFQGVLDDFAAGRIDEKVMLERTGWEERWGYDWALYQPIVRLAVDTAARVLALNAPKELTRKVGKGGLDSLSPDERAQLPELVLDDEEHRAWFKAATDGHGGSADESFEHFYTAQVIWDETMAQTAWTWLGGQGDRGGKSRRIAILAGTGHCMDAAIPRRLRRRGAAKVVSIQAVIDDGQGSVADLLAAPENDYLVVLDVGASTHGSL